MISVIVVTFNRKVLLEQCLQSLLAQDLSDAYEVVVVDNGSTDGTDEWITDLSMGHIKYIRNPEAMDVSLCKEIGVLSASGDVVAFTDDDCVVAPGWLGNIKEGLRECDVVGGVVLPVKGVRFPDWWRPSLEWIVGINSDPGMHFFPLGSNTAFRREAFQNLGTPAHRPFFGPYGEDNARLRASLKAGYKLRINKAMIVYHHIGDERLRLSYFIRRSYREGQCLAQRKPVFSVFLSMIAAFLVNPFRFLVTLDTNFLFRMCVSTGYVVTYFSGKR